MTIGRLRAACVVVVRVVDRHRVTVSVLFCAGWLVGWLACWLVGWLVGWLGGWVAAERVGSESRVGGVSE